MASDIGRFGAGIVDYGRWKFVQASGEFDPAWFEKYDPGFGTPFVVFQFEPGSVVLWAHFVRFFFLANQIGLVNAELRVPRVQTSEFIRSLNLGPCDSEYAIWLSETLWNEICEHCANLYPKSQWREAKTSS